MTAQPTSGCWHPLIPLVDDAHDHAVAALDAGRALDAVVWLSAHLAASQRTLHRLAARQHVAGQTLNSLRAADHELVMLLRRMEQHYSGDVLAAQLDRRRLDRSLRQALDAHADAECALLDVLELEEADVATVSAAYTSALQHAPTRPHPHAPHRGVLGAAAFRLDAWRDHMMDTMDGRHVPAPRAPRQSVAPGRWGNYLLGQMDR